MCTCSGFPAIGGKGRKAQADGSRSALEALAKLSSETLAGFCLKELVGVVLLVLDLLLRLSTASPRPARELRQRFAAQTSRGRPPCRARSCLSLTTFFELHAVCFPGRPVPPLLGSALASRALTSAPNSVPQLSTSLLRMPASSGLRFQSNTPEGGGCSSSCAAARALRNSRCLWRAAPWILPTAPGACQEPSLWSSGAWRRKNSLAFCSNFKLGHVHGKTLQPVAP